MYKLIFKISLKIKIYIHIRNVFKVSSWNIRSFLSLGLENSISQNIRNSFRVGFFTFWTWKVPSWNFLVFQLESSIFGNIRKLCFLKYDKRFLFLRKYKKFFNLFFFVCLFGFFCFLSFSLKMHQVAAYYTSNNLFVFVFRNSDWLTTHVFFLSQWFLQ